MEGTLFALHLSAAEIEAKIADVLASPKDNGTLEMIVRRPAENSREVIESGFLSVENGLVGDNWLIRGSSRTDNGLGHPEMQLNLMNWRFINLIAGSRERVQLAGDQLFVDLDLGPDNLPPGTRLVIGDAEIEITPIPHLGCKKFVARFGMDAMKYANSDFGREHNLRGVNAKVVTAGDVAVGDRIRLATLTMKMRAISILFLMLITAVQALSQKPNEQPNIIIIFADDHGYSDIGSFAKLEGYKTPNLDRMAVEGIRLTDFYVATSVCSASRAALLTGSYSVRIGITGALDHKSNIGLNPTEITIPELLKTRGYATAIFGKWHLGHYPEFLPTQQGFDEYFGLPYSNDMWPHHPIRPNYYPPLPLIEGSQTIAVDPDQSQLTTKYTERAVKFIESHAKQPFFMYLAHSMPHAPLFVSDKFKGKTERGLYGDVIEELDWSVGQVLDTLKRLKLDKNTLVIFTSDNGPWAEYGDHAGSAKPLRGSKGTAFEGGVRVPFIARWPGRIPKGRVSRIPTMTIDLLPTVARLAQADIPSDRIIDGVNIWPVLSGDRKANDPHEALYFYWENGLHAVRSGKWKLHFPHPYRDVIQPGSGGKPGPIRQSQFGLSLFDLDQDPGELNNVLDKNPDVVRRLTALAEKAREDMGDSLVKREGKNIRPAGKRVTQ